MTHRLRRVVVGAAALLLAADAAAAQTTRVGGSSASTDRFGFYWETHLTPPVPPLADGFGTAVVTDVSGVIHRVLLDRARKVVFGYDVRVEPEAGVDTYRLVFDPLSMTPEVRELTLGGDNTQWRQLAGPAISTQWQGARVGVPPVGAQRSEITGVRRGQVLELHLLTTDSGQTLTDYVTIDRPWPKTQGFSTVPAPDFHFSAGPARDFAVGDVQLELIAPRVNVNGRPEPSSDRASPSSTARGAVVWFYLPGRGRYLLSLAPRQELGFRRAGEIRGSIARFTFGEETITLLSGDRIAPGAGAYTLYVLRDPAWRPTYAHANTEAFIIGAADRAEYVVGASGR
jgi:hypothetical protein